MKRRTLAFALCILLSACNNKKTINGVTYDVYGVYNENEKRNPAIEYEFSVGSIIAAVVFSETIIVPIYVVAVDLWQPVAAKPTIKGAVTE